MSLTVLIAGRPYPLKIHPHEEDLIKKVVQEINEQINEFQVTYHPRNQQDCLAMVLLARAVAQGKDEPAPLNPNYTTPFLLDRVAERIAALETILQQAALSD